MGYRINKRIGYGFSQHEVAHAEEREFMEFVNKDVDQDVFKPTPENAESFATFCRQEYGDYLQAWGFTGKDAEVLSDTLSIHTDSAIALAHSELPYLHPNSYSPFTGDDEYDESDLGLLISSMAYASEWYRHDDAIDYAEAAAGLDDEDGLRPKHILLRQDIFPLHTSGYFNWHTGAYVHDRNDTLLIELALGQGSERMAEDVNESYQKRFGMDMAAVQTTFAKAAPHLMIATALWSGLFTHDAALWARRMNPMLHIYWS